MSAPRVCALEQGFEADGAGGGAFDEEDTLAGSFREANKGGEVRVDQDGERVYGRGKRRPPRWPRMRWGHMRFAASPVVAA